MLQPKKPADYSAGLKQFSKFLVVGFSNFLISFAVFYLLYNHWKLSGIFYGLFGQVGKDIEKFIREFGAASLDATLANIVGYSAGIINSFIWNKLWTFQVRHQISAQFGRFLTLNLFCLVASSASLFLFTDFLGWAYLPVWFVTMGIVTLVNFFLSKIWVFAEAEKQEESLSRQNLP
ncbi:MAG: GtrA family protein [Deltaproteobacteria bacterium]|jgi:putative flippase GtrA|nr:GtrA family protein [Deltaproteobacteria bacterium]